jgi:hypothetical protein
LHHRVVKGAANESLHGVKRVVRGTRRQPLGCLPHHHILGAAEADDRRCDARTITVGNTSRFAVLYVRYGAVCCAQVNADHYLALLLSATTTGPGHHTCTQLCLHSAGVL